MNMEYEAIRTYYTTVNDDQTGRVLDTILNYERNLPRRSSRGDAITDGFAAWGHDDFNIAVWEGDELVSWDWMDEPVEDEEGLVGRRSDLGLDERRVEGADTK